MTTDVTRLFPDLGVGIIGAGFMSTVHARAARSAGADVIGVASSSPESAERARADLGLGVAYPSAEALLGDERISVVHICTPNSTHRGFAEAAIAAGKHVICEKPLATTVTEAEGLVRAASEAGVVAAVPFVYRFHPMVREARARVLGGSTGRVFSIHGVYLQDWLVGIDDDDWRVDPVNGGPSRAFADIGSHLCDLIEFVVGDPIERLVSRIRTVHADRAINKAITTEDVVTVVFETEGGSVGTLHVSQVSAGHKNRLEIEIDAEHESLIFDQENPDELLVGTKAGFLRTRRSDSIDPSAARYSRVPAGHPQGYQDAFNAFVADTYAAIRNMVVPDGLPLFADGLRAAVITDAVLRSHESGTWVATATRPAFTIAS